MHGLRPTRPTLAALCIAAALVGVGPGTSWAADPADATPPEVVEIAVLDPVPVSKAPSRVFTLTFSEPVTGVVPESFAPVTTGSATARIASVTGEDADYVVTVDSIAGTGTLGLQFSPAGAPPPVADLAGNVALPTQSAPVGVDRDAPVVSSFGPTAAGETTADFTIEFTEPVAGVDESDFSLVTTGSVSGDVTAVAGEDSRYVVTVTVTGGSGALGLRLNDRYTRIADVAGNLAVGNVTERAFTVVAVEDPASEPQATTPGTTPVTGAGDPSSDGAGVPSPPSPVGPSAAAVESSAPATASAGQVVQSGPAPAADPVAVVARPAPACSSKLSFRSRGATRGSAPLDLHWAAPSTSGCTATVRLTAPSARRGRPPMLVGAATATIGRALRERVVVRLNPAGRRLLARHGRLVADLTLRIDGELVMSQGLTIRLAHRPGHRR